MNYSQMVKHLTRLEVQLESKKTPEATRTVKPAARRPEPAQLARAKSLDAAKKSGRLEDFAALILKQSPN